MLKQSTKKAKILFLDGTDLEVLFTSERRVDTIQEFILLSGEELELSLVNCKFIIISKETYDI